MSVLVIDSPVQPLPMPDAQGTATQWMSGATAIGFGSDIDIVVFFNGAKHVHAEAAHVADGQRIRKFIEAGGAFLAFLSEPDSYRLANLTGVDVQVGLPSQHSATPRNYMAADGPYYEWFSQHASQFKFSPSLAFPESLAVTPLAKHRETGLPIAFLARISAGLLVVLPAPADAGLPVMQAIDIARSLMDVPAEHWLSAAEYWMPQLRTLKDEEADIRERFNAELAGVGARQQAIMDEFQRPAERLLTQGSTELVEAVIWALDKLGVAALDVDALKPPPKEEDLWLAAEPIAADAVAHRVSHLAEVKGERKRTCSDDDLGALTRYLHRRGREWKRSDLSGLMVFNHMYGRPPGERQSAFSSTQIADAERDHVGLLSTVVLFQMLQQVFVGQLSVEDAKSLILNKAGLITL